MGKLSSSTEMQSRPKCKKTSSKQQTRGLTKMVPRCLLAAVWMFKPMSMSKHVWKPDWPFAGRSLDQTGLEVSRSINNRRSNTSRCKLASSTQGNHNLITRKQATSSKPRAYPRYPKWCPDSCSFLPKCFRRPEPRP